MIVRFDAATLTRGGVDIVRALSLEIPRGGPFAILGPSGAGKSTLVWGALGLLRPRQGRIEVAGAEPWRLSPRDRAKLVGLVFQDCQLFPHLTALQNIELAPRLHLTEPRELERHSRDLLEELGIAGLGGRRPHELSGGQKQRVAIARSLILEPRVLFLDEPSAALDEKTTVELAALLTRLNERSQIVVVSHDRVLVETLCTQGARLEAGEIATMGPIRACLP